MRRRSRQLLLLVGCATGLLVALVVGGGYLLPVDHVASGSAVVPQPPVQVFLLLTNVEAYPSWRSDVQAVDVLPGANGQRRWRERGGNGEIVFEEVESLEPLRRVTRIADESLPFGGTWTFELVAEEGGTRVTITEHGQVFNPVFRFMSRFVFGHTATIDAFLADLSKASVRRPA